MHCSVVRGVDRCLVVVDMPFGSYQGNSKEALNSAIRIMKETGGHSVKLEGGEEVIESVKRISQYRGSGDGTSWTYTTKHL